MRKLLLLTLIAAASLLGTPAAQAAPSCIGVYCDWILNGGFEQGTDRSADKWSDSPDMTFPAVRDSCLSGAPITKVAEFTRGETGPSWVSQLRYPTYGTHYQVAFHIVDLIGDTNSWWDVLRVTVTDYNTNTVEQFTIQGSQFDVSNCATHRWTFNLSNNYYLHNVEVKFEIGAFTTAKFQIDNVSLWSWP